MKANLKKRSLISARPFWKYTKPFSKLEILIILTDGGGDSQIEKEKLWTVEIAYHEEFSNSKLQKNIWLE